MRPCRPRLPRARARIGGSVVTRSPAIVGNWKLWGTRAQAGRVLRAAARAAARTSAAGPPTSALCAPFTALDVCRRDAATAAGVLVYAQNMHAARRPAPTPGRCRRRCSPSSAIDGVVLGHSERRQYFGETDRALQEKVPAALDGRAAADPLRGRDRGRARGRRDRAQAAPPGAGGAREGRDRAARGGDDRLRAGLGHRHGQGRQPRPGRRRSKRPSASGWPP